MEQTRKNKLMLSHLEVIDLQRCYATRADSSSPTFRYTLSVPFHAFFLNFLILEETSVNLYQLTLRKTPEERRSRLQRGKA